MTQNNLDSILTIELDYNILHSQLKDHHFPRNAISYLLKTGELIRVKKGLYVKAKGLYSRLVLANMIYGPSYVSLDSALAEHGLIPEHVHTVTSMTLGRRKQFETPVGNFTYEPLSANLFSLGLQRRQLSETQAYLIATPEKALVDTIYRHSDLKNEKMLEDFLVYDRRIDLDLFASLSLTRLNLLARAYKRAPVTALVTLVSKRKMKDE